MSRRKINIDVPSLAKQYAAGASIQALANELEVSFGVVRQRLLDAGVGLRGRNGAPAKSTPKAVAKSGRWSPEARARDSIRWLVENVPPLTDEQRKALRLLVRTAPVA